jgi:diadenylate cyclase
MAEFNFPAFLGNLLSGFGLTDIIDILVVAFVAYTLLSWIRETRAEQLIKGLVLLIVATYLSELLHLHTIHWLLQSVLTIGAIALVVVFQPELRRGLETLGQRTRFFSFGRERMEKEESKRVSSAIVNTVEHFSANHVGALIVIEQQTALNDIAETGTALGAKLSEQLLGSIFYEGTPLHDGAVIVRDDQILAAGCVLPLSQNRSISKDLGTRHRAGLGISENSDAIVIIVSEETGIISVAQGGTLTRFLDGRSVEKLLLNAYLSRTQTSEKQGLDSRILNSRLFRRGQKGGGSDE